MPNLKSQTAKAFPKVEKIERDAFLYFNHHANSPKEQFAQCASCRMFVPDYNGGACIIHGSRVRVDGKDSCGLYVIWPEGKPNPAVVKAHGDELRKNIEGSVTPEESGLVDRKVRCENCYHFDTDGHCYLYEKLNTELSDLFNLNTNVDEYGCCNANTAIPGEDNDES